jgi:DNA mismatch repair protein MutS2
MDDKSIEILEFHRVREILAGLTSFQASRELAMTLQPLSDREEISLLLSQSAEARHLLSLKPDLSLAEVGDVRQAVAMAARGKVLQPQTILEVEKTLAIIRQFRAELEQLSKKVPLLWGIASSIVQLPQLEKAIAKCLDPSGQVLDSASRKLATIRQRLVEVRQQVLGRLEAIMKTPQGRKTTQVPVVMEREGRYVIPVKMEFRRAVKGIVHDVSNTGATVFVEPWGIVELGNELRELVTEERREIERILGDLSTEVGDNEAHILRNVALVAELDVSLAKARYAWRSQATEPKLTVFDEGGNSCVLKLAEARHPLLAQKAVPLSIEIGRDFSCLVITGPNTGGKTVALKTIGLLSLMAQSGIPIPASGESSLPVFDAVFADIGDEQSIEQTLSTFGWHMGNVVRIVKNATEKSLVLLDELGTSTDPAEGSALARSVLLHFLARRTMTVATTHYGELKVFAHVTPGMQNASFDFDPATLKPTFHLTVGVPGGSNALVTASRLGLPSEIVGAAREMLPKGTQELEALLADLAGEKRRLEALRHDLETEKADAERRSTELANVLQQSRAEERRIIEEARDSVLIEAAKLHKEIRQAESELRKEKAREGIERARKALSAVREQTKSQAWQPRANKAPGGYVANENAITAGDSVLLKETGLQATVLSVSEKTQQVEVQAGQTRLKLNLDSLEKVSPSCAGARPVSATVTKVPRRQAVSLELDLRGKRTDDVELLLDSYLNNAFLANLSKVRIVHGVGTGTVRKTARDCLASHPLVESFRPAERREGGEGATNVFLKTSSTCNE